MQPAPAQPQPSHHRCFENSIDGKNAIKKMPSSFRSWLTEDAVFLITPDERCTFLHLNTDEERDQFVEQFWYRRDPNPDAPDNSFKVEHYRRIAFVNQKYPGPIDGWKTDRGRIYVILGPPDSVEASARTGKAGESSPPTEKWHYPCLDYTPGIDLVFIDPNSTGDYRLVFPGGDSGGLFSQDNGHPSCDFVHSSLVLSSGQTQIHIGLLPAQITRYKDLEALATVPIVRDQLHFRSQFQFLPTTRATTLARLTIDFAATTDPSRDQGRPLHGYALFVRAVSSSGRVADISESLVGGASQHEPDVGPIQAQVDLPLSPGSYQLAIVAKNLTTNEVGVVHSSLDVPSYEALAQK
jgi:GWxTD domain-containing protein